MKKCEMPTCQKHYINYLINMYDHKLHTTGNMTQNVRINMNLYILLTISHA